MSDLTWANQNGVTTVTFVGTRIMDERSIQSVGVALMQAVAAAHETKQLVIDFSGVQAVSSAILGKIVLLNNKSKADNIELRFTGMSTSVRDVFNRFFGDGPMGLHALLKRPPDTGGGHATPESADS